MGLGPAEEVRVGAMGREGRAWVVVVSGVAMGDIGVGSGLVGSEITIWVTEGFGVPLVTGRSSVVESVVALGTLRLSLRCASRG